MMGTRQGKDDWMDWLIWRQEEESIQRGLSTAGEVK